MHSQVGLSLVTSDKMLEHLTSRLTAIGRSREGGTCSAGRPALDEVGRLDIPVDIPGAVHLLQGIQHAQACRTIPLVRLAS